MLKLPSAECSVASQRSRISKGCSCALMPKSKKSPKVPVPGVAIEVARVWETQHPAATLMTLAGQGPPRAAPRLPE